MTSGVEHKVVVVEILFLALTITTTLLRCYVRAVMVKSFGADDKLAVLSLVSVSMISQISNPQLLD